MPEIMTRSSSSNATLKPLRSKFFKDTSVAFEKKFTVAASILMSRQFFGAGGWPIPTVAERQQIHAKVMATLRTVASEKHDPEQPGLTLTDAQLLEVYNIRSPYSFVRFARMRLSVRVALRAPLGLLALLFHARTDPKSWIRALEDDLRWLAVATKAEPCSIEKWFIMCRSYPKSTRSLIRKVCDSPEARSLVLGETKVRSGKILQLRTCHCGVTCKSNGGLAIHRAIKHGCFSVVSRFADPSHRCIACLTQFSNAGLLSEHLQYGSRICFLNTLLRIQPKSDVADAFDRAVAADIKKANVHKGLHRNSADRPAYRTPGPLLRLIGLDGNLVAETSAAHPWGKGKHKRNMGCST